MVRLKHRYYLVNIIFDDDCLGHRIGHKVLYDAINSLLEDFYGDNGVACIQSNLSVKYLNIYTNLILIRVRRQFHKMLGSVLPFIKSVKCDLLGKDKKLGRIVDCLVNTVHVSGTIRSAQKFIIKFNKKKIEIILQRCENEALANKIRKSVFDKGTKII
uniref:ribonuclease P/MRP protein subunit POP5-like n=1 Tax=Ciona intestinalis TaxID=7719 RepID=UPI000180B981|nr:ribonuclease P/MRP protein subunit POP5-like [Ciona intestinalis]|eukprot:XP_026694324.1 ribonuclease P/MRP protein subunit POP5-like [Ciona intestinalis]